MVEAAYLPVMRQVVQDLHHEDEAGLLGGRAPCIWPARICNGCMEGRCMMLAHPLPLQSCQLGTDLYAGVAQPVIQISVLFKEVILHAYPGQE